MADMIQVEEQFALLTADGGTDGSLTVTDASVFFSGCVGFVGSATVPAKRIIIVSVDDTANKVYARVIADDNEQQQKIQVYGGKSDFSAYAMTNGAYVAMESQLARVEYSYTRIPNRNI